MSDPVFRPRVHVILLGVADVARSAQFYQSLGWERAATSHPGFVKFDLGGAALALISKTDLASDALGDPGDPGASSATALIYCAEHPQDVARLLALAERAGATIVKPATQTQWGTAGYFRDPDGHLFEVDYEESWILDEEHHLAV